MQEIPLVRDFMSTNLIVVEMDTDIFAALSLLLDHKISGAPVVKHIEDDKALMGILTEKDCMSIIANGAFYDLPGGKVSDYMSEVVVTIGPTVDLFAAADKFIQSHYRRIPVINEGLLVGIIARRDVLYSSRRLWQNQHAPNAPDPGYLTEKIKGKLGDTGISHIHKKIG